MVSPFAKLLATGQVRSGDVLCIDRCPGENRLTFLKENELCSYATHMLFAAPIVNQLTN